MISGLLQGVGGLLSLASIVCFVLVLVEMFKRKETTPAIISLVLSPCCGIGMIYALVYTYPKAAAWNIETLMNIWLAVFLAGLVTGGLTFLLNFTL
jgi:hypothetical protein